MPPNALDKHMVTDPSTGRKKPLEGREKVAVLLLALGDKHGAPIWRQLDELELKEVSQAMATLGALTKEMIEEVLVEFVTGVTSNQSLAGGFDTTERLLSSFMDADNVTMIMEEIRGPAGRNMWEKLSNVQENVLASYLKNEYPQTVAVVLSKIRPDHAAKVLSIFPEEFALEVINRMLRMESVQKDILDKVEQTLRSEFMSNLSQTRRRDSHELMAEIFNSFDRQTEAKFMSTLEEDNRESAEKIKSLMFTFEDLSKLDSASTQTLLRGADAEKLKLALKGAPEPLREFFFSNMSSRQATNMQEDLEAMGPVRLRDVDEAQMSLVNLAKDLAAKGEIIISTNNADDEIIY
jgi:flagellar motor switch protein FliG